MRNTRSLLGEHCGRKLNTLRPDRVPYNYKAVTQNSSFTRTCFENVTAFEIRSQKYTSFCKPQCEAAHDQVTTSKTLKPHTRLRCLPTLPSHFTCSVHRSPITNVRSPLTAEQYIVQPDNLSSCSFLAENSCRENIRCSMFSVLPIMYHLFAVGAICKIYQTALMAAPDTKFPALIYASQSVVSRWLSAAVAAHATRQRFTCSHTVVTSHRPR